MIHHVLFVTVLISFVSSTPIWIKDSSDLFLTKLDITNYYVNTPGIGRHKLNLAAKTWEDARVTCLNEGAHLAVIRSLEEETILLKKMAERNITGPSDVWLGVHEQFKKDEWISVFNERIDAIGYFNWREGEPNNSGDNEHCISLSESKFNDQNCANKKPFFCKI